MTPSDMCAKFVHWLLKVRPRVGSSSLYNSSERLSTLIVSVLGTCKQPGFTNTYLYASMDALWTYDPWPEASARQQLIDPKPDFAFGVKVNAGTTWEELVLQASELTYPPVTPFCILDSPLQVVCPFFVWESTNLQGDPMTCNNQMANDLIKALDIVASLGLQKTLYTIGVSQYGFVYEIYLASSSDGTIRPSIPRNVSQFHCSRNSC